MPWPGRGCACSCGLLLLLLLLPLQPLLLPLLPACTCLMWASPEGFILRPGPGEGPLSPDWDLRPAVLGLEEALRLRLRTRLLGAMFDNPANAYVLLQVPTSPLSLLLSL